MAVHEADPLESLRAHGLRVTPQRRAIVSVFADADTGHLTADEVHARARQALPELSRATVYNVLGEFVRVGLLQAVEGLGALRYDRNLDEGHHHFRCLVCDRLYDVHPSGAARLGVRERGFVVERRRILLEGRCPECAARG